MRILAIEGALARCSVALLADGAVLAAEGEDTARGHAAILPAMAQRVLQPVEQQAPVVDDQHAVADPLHVARVV